MVHALGEIRRVLKPGGILIDIRPREIPSPIEIAQRDGSSRVGALLTLPNFEVDDKAANQAMASVEAQGWFRREQEETFSYFYYWDTPSEMKHDIFEEWEEPDKLSEADYKATQSAWAVANAEARVRVKATILITRWKCQ